MLRTKYFRQLIDWLIILVYFFKIRSLESIHVLLWIIEIKIGWRIKCLWAIEMINLVFWVIISHFLLNYFLFLILLYLSMQLSHRLGRIYQIQIIIFSNRKLFLLFKKFFLRLWSLLNNWIFNLHDLCLEFVIKFEFWFLNLGFI